MELNRQNLSQSFFNVEYIKHKHSYGQTYTHTYTHMQTKTHARLHRNIQIHTYPSYRKKAKETM